MPQRDKVVTSTCPACTSSRLRSSRPSRRTGNVVDRCRDCGLRFLRERWTAPELNEAYDVDREHYERWVAGTRTATIDASHDEVLQRLVEALPDQPRTLFDVGAGSGAFLARAREAGFEPAGNELASGAVELAREAHDIELHLGDLDTLDEHAQFQAVTLWCVLAHVPDGDPLLSGVRRVLAPGGLMYLQTPRFSGMDILGELTWQISRGRSTRILDRRLAIHHMFLHTERSIRAMLDRLGFEAESIEPKARYSLRTANYLGSIGVPRKLTFPLARPLDLLVDRGWFFRNVLDVYARHRR